MVYIILKELLDIEEKAKAYTKKIEDDIQKKEQILTEKLAFYVREIETEKREKLEQLHKKIELDMDTEFVALRESYKVQKAKIENEREIEKQAQFIFEQVIEQAFGQKVEYDFD